MQLAFGMTASYVNRPCSGALPLPLATRPVLSSHACRPLALEMPPEVEVELARRVPCSVTYHEITRDRKVER